MTKKTFILTIFTLLNTTIFAQHFEMGVLLGGSNYLGDLSNNSSKVYLDETRFAGGAFVRYNFGERLVARLSFNYAGISGNDFNSNDAAINARNLGFKSSLLELGVMGEFNILGYQPYGLYRVFSPYIFVGVTGTKFNPKANYEGEWVALQPLGTEGQGLPQYPEREAYNTTVITIPFGIGVKYAVTDKLNIGFEIGARRAFTDYLDDVSGTYVSSTELVADGNTLGAALSNRTGELTGGEPVVVPTGTARGDDTGADWYFITGVTVSYNFLDNGLMGGRKRGRSRKGCKSSSF